MDTDSEIPLLPSSSIYQSCVTNSGLMVSRISQVTQPLAISVNTNFVMSHQSETNSTDTKGKHNHLLLQTKNLTYQRSRTLFSAHLKISEPEQFFLVHTKYANATWIF